MKLFKKNLNCKFSRICFFAILVVLPLGSFAQVVIDNSSPGDHLVEPTIVIQPTTIQPDCATYTGCGLIVLKKHEYSPPKHNKIKRYQDQCQSCCFYSY